MRHLPLHPNSQQMACSQKAGGVLSKTTVFIYIRAVQQVHQTQVMSLTVNFTRVNIAETMGLNAVHYDLENWKGILASKCKLFTDIDTSYIPIGRIVKSGGIKGLH